MEQPREWDLIAHGEMVARRAIRLLRDNSRDHGALLEASRGLQTSIRNIRITDGICSSQGQRNLLARLQEIHVAVRELTESNERLVSGRSACRALPIHNSSRRGRPKLDIKEESIKKMVSSGMNGTAMAEAFGCGMRTLARRLAALDITLGNTGASDAVGAGIRDSRQVLPGAGANVIHGHLVSKGIKASRDQTRRILPEQDPYGGAQRQSKMIIRRRYHVAGCRALYHMDGNAKLNMYNIWIEGMIDGFSRRVIFCRADTNNRAETVKAGFLAGVARCGFPSRLRTDRGLENVGAARVMIAAMGPGRGSVITGKSVHNQRIERWWRDLTSTVTRFFKQLFIQMEQTGIFDVTNDLHLMVLHYVFLPRISESIHQFVEAWNHHKIRTARYMSPMQMWEQGRHRQEMFGRSWQGPMPEELPLNRSDLATEFPEQWEVLESQVDPLAEDNNVGVTLFLHCMQLLGL